MKSLPTTVEFYQRTPEFTQDTLPNGLRKSHQTKAKVWGRIVVLEGQLRYRILEPSMKEFLLDKDQPGVIEPSVQHEVEPTQNVRFFVEFYR